MSIWPIETDEQHRAALKEIEALWGAAEGTPEGERLDVLATLVERYEGQIWPEYRLARLGGRDPHATAGRRRRAG